ncbi:hypothetical protein HYC85_007654 [Camellia sinensis]|uniref:Pentacotripeptide-repeat region of PRORP domain-containing protein n=1 Tax=Camellia sinensis TaxID=4442 RepID=A0A7J7HS04_CAMSI|nr:hypothetical protein HYC85_007654 [Camellia sinensis]
MLDYKQSTECEKLIKACQFSLYLLATSLTPTLEISSSQAHCGQYFLLIEEPFLHTELCHNKIEGSRGFKRFKGCCWASMGHHGTHIESELFNIICFSLCLLQDINKFNKLVEYYMHVQDKAFYKILLMSFGPCNFNLINFDHKLLIFDTFHTFRNKISSSFSSLLLSEVRTNEIPIYLYMHYELFRKILEEIFNDLISFPVCLMCNFPIFVEPRKGPRKDLLGVFDKLREKKQFALDLWGYNICIHAFGCWGDLGMSLSLFREMKERSQGSDGSFGPDLCTYNSLIHILCLAGKVKDALIVWEELKDSGHEPDASTYRIIIQGCCKSYRIDDAIKIFSEMQYNGFCPDNVVYNSLLDGLLKARRLTEACQLFEKMVEDGVRASCWTYNILIDGLFKNGRAVAGYTLFCDLKKKGPFVDGITYSIVILCLCREGQIEDALQLVEEMEGRGFVVDLVTMTSLLIGLHRQGRGEWTERLMKHIRDGNLVPTVLKWKANMEAYVKSPQSRNKDFTPMFPSKGDFSDIMNLISSHDMGIDIGPDLKADGHQDEEFPSSDTDPWSSSPYMDRLANQVNSNDHSIQTFSLSRGRRVQVKCVDSFDIDMVNTYLSIFLAKGKLSLACKLFEIFTNMGVNPVSYTYNSMMSSFVKRGYFNEAWGVLHEMGENGGYLDIVMYNTLINALGKAGRIDEASKLFEQMRTNDILDICIYSTSNRELIKLSCFDSIISLYLQMHDSYTNPWVVIWNVNIALESRFEQVKKSLRYLLKLVKASCGSNATTETILDLIEKDGDEFRLVSCRNIVDLGQLYHQGMLISSGMTASVSYAMAKGDSSVDLLNVVRYAHKTLGNSSTHLP